MAIENIDEIIKPFILVKHADNTTSVCLSALEYKKDLFEEREDEGFEGNGHDWASLARIFLEEKIPELREDIKFDPESSMFCVYSNNENAIKKFILSFKKACEDSDLIRDLFSRAILDA